ncbi:MAG: hypothetical protein M1829_000099 [Trizodia sp. TS-e1964]|nr:MAG: hypothetical protein M1829_000099 [Trizodia sp. TS-e1964]
MSSKLIEEISPIEEQLSSNKWSSELAELLSTNDTRSLSDDILQNKQVVFTETNTHQGKTKSSGAIGELNMMNVSSAEAWEDERPKIGKRHSLPRLPIPPKDEPGLRLPVFVETSLDGRDLEKITLDGADVDRDPTPPPPPPKDDIYLDPTPKTPRATDSPSRATAGDNWKLENNEKALVSGQELLQMARTLEPSPPSDERKSAFLHEDHGRGSESTSEIRGIMDQFELHGEDDDTGDLLTSGLDFAAPMPSDSIQHPPRISSLETSKSTLGHGPPQKYDPSIRQPLLISRTHPIRTDLDSISFQGPSSAQQPDPQTHNSWTPSSETPMSPAASSVHGSVPPEPDPEPDLPFDFHRFLEQLRHRTADPVAKFLRSFLLEFGKKQWMVHEQMKIIADFLTFITNKMAQCEVWRGVSDAEFDNAKEGMEKLVMNRLYAQTFSPAIPLPQQLPPSKGRRRGQDRVFGPGRRGQHQEDVERDEVLAQKVQIYGWVREEHLDIAPVGESGIRFLNLAQQELLKIRTYRAPRDKIICVLNCCKVIFGLLRNSKSDTSADSFIPLLIYVVLQAKPENLVSNLQYILRFRNQYKLVGEAGYYLSSLMGAVQFIENLDRTNLTVSDEEFEKNVEAAVSAIAEKHEEKEAMSSHALIPEKSSLSKAEVTPRNSLEGEHSDGRRGNSSSESVNPSSTSNGSEENAAVAGLLRTIQRPLSTIGRIFSEDPSPRPRPHPKSPRSASTLAPKSSEIRSSSTPQMGSVPHRSSSLRRSSSQEERRLSTDSRSGRITPDRTVEDAAARQASAETAEARRIQLAEHQDVVE